MKKEIIRQQSTGTSKAYLKLAKKIKHHWLWKASRKKSKFEAWLDLLIRANFTATKEPVGHDLIELQKGQVLCSQEGLAIDWGWDRSAVRHFLKLLEKDMMITSNITSKFTVITICNYESYNTQQPAEQPAEHQVNFDDMSESSPDFSHDKELPNSELQEQAASKATSKQHQNNTDKNSKNKKNNINTVPFESDDLNAVWQDWIVFRTQKKEPLTPIGADRQIKKLQMFDPSIAAEIINKSIESGWTGLFFEKYEARKGQVVQMPKIVKAVSVTKDDNILYEDGKILPAFSWNQLCEIKAGRLDISVFDRRAS
jgi:DNA replication protein DnaD